MMKKTALVLAAIFCMSIYSTAQIKLFSSGSIAFGGTTDPGGTKSKFYGETIFDQKVTFNNGSNIFEAYSSAGGGLTILGTAGTLSMYPDGNYYKLNTSEDKFMFEDAVQFQNGLSVTIGSSADFYSTTTFNRDVNFGQYGTVNENMFYGDVTFTNANSSAEFRSQMDSEFSCGLSVYCYLTVYGTFTEYSDVNLKTKISEIEKGSLDKINNLQGVNYNFKIDKEDQTPRAGFIAQDLQKVFPDLVVEEKEGFAIKSLELLPYLVEAIKEQQLQIKTLQTEISSLSPSQTLKGASVGEAPEDDQLNIKSELFQNTPNPFTDQTKIKYNLSDDFNSAMIYIYDMTGKQLRSYNLPQEGNGEITIDEGDLDAGLYLYSMITDGALIGSRQMILTD